MDPTPARGTVAAPTRPRVWPVFLGYVAVFVAQIAVGAIVVGIGMISRLAGRPGLDRGRYQRILEDVTTAPSTMIAALGLSAVILFAAALGGAGLSPEPTRARLRVGPGRWPVWRIALGVVAFYGLSEFLSAIPSLAGWHSNSIEAFVRTVSRSSPAAIALLLVLAGLASPIAEELFFRGYVQTRLGARWGPWPAILVTALAFGLLHLDLVHAPFALLVGIALGWMTERSGSVRPAIAAHVANNTLSIVLTKAGIDGVRLGLSWLAITLVIAAVGFWWVRRPQLSG